MANDKIFVKLTQTPSTLSGLKVVTSGAVQLVARGPGNTAITTSDQPATIEFFEESDNTTAILTISSTAKLDGGGPKFNLTGATPTSSVVRSDFVLPLTFDPSTFDGSQFASAFPLKLPWRVIKHNNVANFRIGAQLKIKGVLEGAFAVGDVLDLPLQHNGVGDDEDPLVSDTCLGVGTVYANNNRFLTSQNIPQTPPGKVEIFLYDGVGSRFAVLTSKLAAPTNFIPDIQANVTTILATGGLRNISVTQFSSSLSMLWKLNLTDGFYYSTNVVDPDNPQRGEGNTLGFFQFYFFPYSGLLATGGDTLGMAEDINEFKSGAKGIDFSNKTKLVLCAGRLLMATGSPPEPMQEALQAAKTVDDQIRVMSNVIAHEVGHALGLRHSFAVTTSGYTPHPPTVGLMGSNSPASTVLLKALGPVHETVLKSLYP